MAFFRPCNIAVLRFTRCFIPNTYAALAGAVGPVLISLMCVALVFTQSYLVTIQWKHYDDIFRGHYNIRGNCFFLYASIDQIFVLGTNSINTTLILLSFLCVCRNPLHYSTVCTDYTGVVVCWASSGLWFRVDARYIYGARRNTGEYLPE